EREEEVFFLFSRFVEPIRTIHGASPWDSQRTLSTGSLFLPTPTRPPCLYRRPPIAMPATRAPRGRLFLAFASLRLAVVLLSLFTACLAGATLVESRYGARIAQDLVYRAWWFAVLLALLAVNVTCAALKKYPWKRHQTGFLITHFGLLLLLAGGLLTSLFGVEGQVVLIDTPN